VGNHIKSGNPHLAQVSISDTVEADEVTSLLMGSAVPPRRAFIVEEAKYAKLDV